MNEDPESCYQPKPPLAQPSEHPFFCRLSSPNFSLASKRSFTQSNQDSWTKKLMLNASKDSNKKNLPPVPKFEETHKK